MKPRFSFCIPTFNKEAYIADCMRSLQKQKIKDWEAIVVDDGSTDDTELVMKYFTDKDKRIKYFKRKENKGIAITRNEAISHAKGEWIAVQDSDDYSYPNRLEVVDKAMKQVKADIYYTNIDWISVNGEQVMEVWTAKPVTAKYLKKDQIVTHGTVVAKKSVFKKIPYRDKQKMNDDMWWILDCFKAGYKFHPIRESTMVYRINQSSVSKIHFKEIQKDCKKARLEVMGWK